MVRPLTPFLCVSSLNGCTFHKNTQPNYFYRLRSHEETTFLFYAIMIRNNLFWHMFRVLQCTQCFFRFTKSTLKCIHLRHKTQEIFCCQIFNLNLARNFLLMFGKTKRTQKKSYLRVRFFWGVISTKIVNRKVFLLSNFGILLLLKYLFFRVIKTWCSQGPVMEYFTFQR